MNKALTVENVAYQYGYKSTFIREACNRSPENHPLPHIKRGTSRPVAYIQPATFEQWLKEEERLQVGLSDEDAKMSALQALQNIRDLFEKFESEIA